MTMLLAPVKRRPEQAQAATPAPAEAPAADARPAAAEG
jgi:hypothetical protein